MIFVTLDSLVGRTILLLSPHADDVAYSIGGIVACLPVQAKVSLMTVFGRSGWAASPELRKMSVDTVSAVRETEDRAYCARHQINYAPFHCPDSFVVGYDEEEELNVTAGDDLRTASVVRLIADFVARMLPDVVLAPCGVGRHIDHQIVRAAAGALDQANILYYEDVPYSAALSLADLESELAAQGLALAATVDIGDVLKSKCEDMWSYRSQTSAPTISQMVLHARRVGAGSARYAERLWRRAHDLSPCDATSISST